MDRSPNSAEEVAESIDPKDQGLPASDPFESVRSESQVLVEPIEVTEDISGYDSSIRKINSSKSPDRHNKKTWGGGIPWDKHGRVQ